MSHWLGDAEIRFAENRSWLHDFSLLASCCGGLVAFAYCAIARVSRPARHRGSDCHLRRRTQCRRLFQLPGLVDEIRMDGFSVSRRQHVVEACHSLGHVGAPEHDGIEDRMRPGPAADAAREIAAAHDMTSGTKAIVEYL